MLQLPVRVSVRHSQVVLLLLLLVIIWLWAGFKPHRHFPDWNPISSLTQSPDSSAPDVFEFPPLDSEAVRSICADAEWNPNLVFTCDNSVGGIGNIRNSILNCVRFAISAGGSLVEPKIVVRNESNTAAIRTDVRTDMGYMFEQDHFRESLRLSCPGLRLYNSIEEAQGGAFHEPIALIPESLEAKDIPRTGLREPWKWREHFYTWLGEHIPATADPETTVIVNLMRSYLVYPVYSDGRNFATSFGRLLKFRADVRALATRTILRLAEKYSPGVIDVALPVLPDLFFGAHLRTEHDARMGWPAQDWVYSRYDTQSKLYIEQAHNASLSPIYVASGDADEVTKFGGDAAAFNITVTTKFALLEEEDAAAVAALSWDQQGMVDFLVMTKASDFGGIGHSSFAWNVALWRHRFATTTEHLKGPQMLSDDLSQIYGQPKQYPEYASCLWP